jgi:putative membrane protein
MKKTMLGIFAAVTFGAPGAALAQEPRPLDPKGRPTLEQPMIPGDEKVKQGGEQLKQGSEQLKQRGEEAMPRTGEMTSTDDQTFMRKAAQAGMAEVKLSKLAIEKTQNPDVKRFAQRLIDDHQKANDELKRIATKKGVTLPSDPDAVQNATYDRLAKLSGEEFDRAFMEENSRMHEDAMRLYQNQANMGKDADLKTFASRTLPTLKQHGDMAKRPMERRPM